MAKIRPQHRELGALHVVSRPLYLNGRYISIFMDVHEYRVLNTIFEQACSRKCLWENSKKVILVCSCVARDLRFRICSWRSFKWQFQQNGDFNENWTTFNKYWVTNRPCCSFEPCELSVPVCEEKRNIFLLKAGNKRKSIFKTLRKAKPHRQVSY